MRRDRARCPDIGYTRDLRPYRWCAVSSDSVQPSASLTLRQRHGAITQTTANTDVHKWRIPAFSGHTLRPRLIRPMPGMRPMPHVQRFDPSVGIVLVALTLTAAGYGFAGWAVTAAIGCVLCLGVGALLIVAEHRSIKADAVHRQAE